LDTKKELVYGASLSVIFTITRLAVSAIGTAVIIKLLLPEEYGLLRWLIIISSYSLLFSQIGSNAIITKHLVRLSTEGKREEKKRFLIDAIAIQNLGLLVSTIVIFGLVLPILAKHSAFRDVSDDVILMGRIIGIAIVLQSNVVLSTKLLEAEFSMVKGRLLDFLAGFIIVFELIFVLIYGLIGAPIGLFVGGLIVFLIGCVVVYGEIYKKYKDVKMSDRGMCGLFLKESSLVFMLLLFNTIFISADMLLLGLYVAPLQVGYYAFAQSIAMLLVPIIASPAPILYPYIIEKHTKGEEKAVVDLSLKLTILIGLSLFGILASVGGIGVRWIFSEYIPAIPLMILLSFFFIWLSLANNVMGPVLNAYSEYVFLMKVKSIIAVMNIVGNIVLIPKFGIYGALCATAVSITLDLGICSWKTLKLTGVSAPIRSTIKMAFSLVIASTFTYSLVKFMSLSTNFPEIIVILIALLLYTLLFVLIFSKILKGFEDMDKTLLKDAMETLPFSDKIYRIYNAIC